MDFRNKLLLDLPQTGQLGADHLRQAGFDVEAAEIFSALCMRVSDGLPEKTVHEYMAACFCNPCLESYRLENAIAMSQPQTGLTRRERIRRECLKWYHAMASGYTPIPLSADEVTAIARRDVRWVQLSNQPQETKNQFQKALKVPIGRQPND
jgi:hypothetical protein